MTSADITIWATIITICGTILTGVYTLLNSLIEHKRHNRLLELEERHAKLDERRLAAELYNQRQLKIFEARLNSYTILFEAIMPLDKRTAYELTPEQALEIEKNIREAFYVKTSHCISSESIEQTAVLRDALVEFSKGKLDAEKLRDVRRDLLRSLHKDLGRTGFYLGNYKPLADEDSENINTIIQK